MNFGFSSLEFVWPIWDNSTVKFKNPIFGYKNDVTNYELYVLFEQGDQYLIDLEPKHNILGEKNSFKTNIVIFDLLWGYIWTKFDQVDEL